MISRLTPRRIPRRRRELRPNEGTFSRLMVSMDVWGVRPFSQEVSYAPSASVLLLLANLGPLCCARRSSSNFGPGAGVGAGESAYHPAGRASAGYRLGGRTGKAGGGTGG